MTFEQEAEQILRKAPLRHMGGGMWVQQLHKAHLKAVRGELEEVYNFGDHDYVDPHHIKDRISEINKELDNEN
jgi:hypothetical protein